MYCQMITKEEDKKSKSTIQEWDYKISSEIEEIIAELTLDLESNLISVVIFLFFN